ncbi:MAG: diguanylate cyclase [Polyangiaceae bacterium]
MNTSNQERTLAAQLSGAFFAFGALVAAAFVLTTVGYGITQAGLTPELERSRQAERAASASHAAMSDEENGLRGYLLTRDPRFLQPYAGGESRLAAAHAALTADVGSVPELAAELLAMRLAEERWRNGWAKAAADMRSGAVAPSMLSGKELFDQYRTEQRLLSAALERHTEQLSLRVQRWTAGRVILELLVFVAILLLAVRQHRALHAAIVTPVAALLRHIRRIRDGSLETAADRVAPRELAELSQGLNELVRALAVAREIAASRDQALGDHSVRLRLILDASREFSESLNLSYVVGSVRESTTAIGGYEKVIVWLMDDEQKRLVDSDDLAPALALEAALEVGPALAGRAAKSGRIAFEGPAGQVRFSDRNLGLVRAIAIPLIVGARVVGVLEARHEAPRPATKEVIEVLEMLATHAATAIESARLHEVIEERSQVDPLTRLLNRRRLEEDLEVECKRSVRYGRPLAFVMLDVDHFKTFNDLHGHPKGDIVLQGVADTIGGCVRTTDTAYRYGGEEFCILLRETSSVDAKNFAERLRQRIEQRFHTGEVLGITASFGVSEFSPDTPTARALVEAADHAMYESKRNGRNSVALSLREVATAELPGDGLVPAVA